MARLIHHVRVERGGGQRRVVEVGDVAGVALARRPDHEHVVVRGVDVDRPFLGEEREVEHEAVGAGRRVEVERHVKHVVGDVVGVELPLRLDGVGAVVQAVAIHEGRAAQAVVAAHLVLDDAREQMLVVRVAVAVAVLVVVLDQRGVLLAEARKLAGADDEQALALTRAPGRQRRVVRVLGGAEAAGDPVARGVRGLDGRVLDRDSLGRVVRAAETDRVERVAVGVIAGQGHHRRVTDHGLAGGAGIDERGRGVTGVVRPVRGLRDASGRVRGARAERRRIGRGVWIGGRVRVVNHHTRAAGAGAIGAGAGAVRGGAGAIATASQNSPQDRDAAGDHGQSARHG